jgi:hypothetical protein
MHVFEREDLTGRRFHFLIVVDTAYRENHCYYWNCVCDCGNTKAIAAHRLKSGRTKSCGCYKLRKGQNVKHGLKSHPLYGVWRGIKERCLNINSKKYPDYGGRGITICPEWQNSMEKFYEDMLPGYQKGLQIDRIDNDKGYCKSNCRWAERLVNANNKRNNVFITVHGETLTAAEWGRKLNIKDNTIANRKLKGFSDEECIYGKTK